MKSKILFLLLLILLIGVNFAFFLNLRNLPDINYPFILIVINLDLLFLIIISAVIFRKLIKVYLGKSQHKLRRKIANVLILYIFIPLLALNILSAVLIFQSTKGFLSGKVRELSKQAEYIYRQLKEYTFKNLHEKKEILSKLSEEEIRGLSFVKEIKNEPCNYDVKEFKGSYLICLGNRYVILKKEITFEQNLEKFGNIALDLRSLTKARDIIMGIYVFLIIALGFITLLATVWLSMLFARYISEPVEKLTENALEISKGNLNVPVEVEERGDEIEKLARAFKQMRDNLKALYNHLKEEKENLQKLLDALPVAVLFRKREGEVFVNRTFLNMFGQPGDINRFLEEVKEAKNIRTEKIERQEGEIYIFEDITPIVLAERFRVWQESVKRIAHEIKNPLTPMKLNLGRILKHLEKDTNREKIRELVNVVMGEVDRINLLVNQFKNLSMERRINPEKFMISELIGEVVKIYQNGGIKIKLEGDREIIGDRNLLKEVFYNLINNSIEHGAKEIKIYVSNGKLIYKDNGRGISKEEAEHIFEPFFSKNPKGFGIGMSIVKKIIEEHGWEVKVYPSEEGFWLEIDFKSKN